MFGLDTTDVEAALALLLNVSLKATLLATVVWLTLTLFRVRSVTIRHRVWSLMLCSMILLPLVIHMAPEVAIPIAWMVNSVSDEISVTESTPVTEAPAETHAQRTTAISAIPTHELQILPDRPQPNSVPLIADNALSPLVVQSPSLAQLHSAATPTVPRSSWMFAVGVIYALGVALLLTRIVVGIVCSMRLVDRARPVNLSSNHDQVPTSARVLQSDEVLVPVTLGVWRPAIVLPADWNTWDHSLVEIAVAHEAEHLRRRDTLVGLLTAVNAALYWFHPIVWLLRRHINELAEQACDDQVIRTTGQRAEYAQVLVDMASHLASGAARYQPAGIGMASKPLVEKRIVRILDDHRPLDVRPGRMRSLLLASLVTTASIVIAGLSAAPDVVSVTTSVDDNADILITGRVTDEAGNGLAGAKLWLPKPPITNDAFETTTYADGHYSLSVPAAATRPGNFTPGWTLFCIAPDRQIGTVSAYGPEQLRSNKQVDFSLQSTSDTGFFVQTTDGKPVPGAFVEPLLFRSNAYEFKINPYRAIPRELRKIIGAMTNDEGRAMLPAIGRDGFQMVQVTAAGYGIQQLRLMESADEPAIRTVTLRPTGRLEGRLISDKSELVQNVTLTVIQDDHPGERTSGAAVIETDNNGMFTVSEFAEGVIEIVPNLFQKSPLPFLPRVPRRLQINAGATTTVEIPYESTVRVQGRVQTKDDSQPVSGARMIVTYGSWQGETVRTDADGRFEADVLPGQVLQQMIGLPETYANWTEEQSIFAQQINVPGDVETFDLPAVEIIPTLQRTGTLLDENNEPVANVEISVSSANRNYGGTSSTDDRAISNCLYRLQ